MEIKYFFWYLLNDYNMYNIYMYNVYLYNIYLIDYNKI